MAILLNLVKSCRYHDVSLHFIMTHFPHSCASVENIHVRRSQRELCNLVMNCDVSLSNTMPKRYVLT